VNSRKLKIQLQNLKWTVSEVFVT